MKKVPPKKPHPFNSPPHQEWARQQMERDRLRLEEIERLGREHVRDVRARELGGYISINEKKTVLEAKAVEFM